MTVKIFPNALTGDIRAIPSKSCAHRLLICAALSDKTTRINMTASSEDIDATIACLRAMGANIEKDDLGVTVEPISCAQTISELDCGESGSTLRFLIPVAAAVCDKAVFTGKGRLPERPITELLQAMSEHGTIFSKSKLPFEVSGGLKGGVFSLPGNISSQYITGLLFALPLLKEDSHIYLTTELESAGYIDITVSALKSFGVSVEWNDREFYIKGSQKYVSPDMIDVDGDWSNAAFFLTAGALGKPISMTGLNPDSPQGDKNITDILASFGAEVKFDEVLSIKNSNLTAANVDIREIPDMLPILSVLAAFSKGDTQFTGGARLRLKESDRLHSCCAMINSLGGRAEETSDGIKVYGTGLRGGTADSFNDHRIAMAAAIAGSMCREPVTILGAEAVKKSYPGFFDDFIKLGGRVNVI